MEENIDLAYALEWQIDAGVDSTLGETPFDLTVSEEEISVPSTSNQKQNVRMATTKLAQDTLDSCEASRKIAKESQNLEDLKEKITKFEGCSLKLTAANTVFGSGNPNAKLMIIGETPNSDDDRKGLPFVGPHGEFLEKMLSAIGFKLESCFLSNIIPWRPPGNRAPTDTEISICLPFIKKQIELVKPEYILMLGGSVANILLENSEPISQIRGKIFEYKKESGKTIKSITTFHPSYLLLNTKQKAKTWSDLIRLKKLFDEN